MPKYPIPPKVKPKRKPKPSPNAPGVPPWGNAPKPPPIPKIERKRGNPKKIGPNWERVHNRGLKRNKRKKGVARSIVLVQ